MSLKKKTSLSMAYKLFNDEENSSKYMKINDLFSELIIKINDMIGGQLQLINNEINLFPEDGEFLCNLFAVGYMGSYMKNTWQSLEELPFMEDALLLNESMKEIVISSGHGVNIDSTENIKSLEELKDKFNLN
jgi:hypothetical protein